ncbi:MULTISPECIES: DUF4331 domain-containing protein [Micromonospora]|uniref:DUF4331 domain-containing protein n=1 Tax=Micromonospora maris TaxID=1003110 RepID=A0A9X0I7Q9_9ACTN|nr:MULTISPECIES: DUF4331 domain-containing protein [Micromonospora]AEB43015.1 hypothetical protein VAB18032_09485 [Micromonospora maris AB-18-032]KUJ48397.1 hypothetical protein ADL17_04925 [Micromonospora maris]RUL93306.1 DUF4331 domain-containing protein [Verrucosispora sp. FIM060022]
MSSHREAPEIAKDPVADSSDLYAFVTPDRPDTVTLIANYVPLQLPSGGPNFFEFGDDVRYDIHIDNNGDGRPDVTYRFEFSTEITNPNSFLYNTGPIEALDSKNWNRRQFYRLTRIAGGKEQVLARKLPCPPSNVGPLSTPKYGDLVRQATFNLSTGEKVFAGQRADGFYVDLGAIFDLGTLRPFQQLHVAGKKIFKAAGEPVNALDRMNVHSIALQVPVGKLRRRADRYHWQEPASVIGVWTSASRRQVRVLGDKVAADTSTGPFTQVSRLGNPLFNEVIVPMAQKDLWNTLPPSEDKRFAQFVEQPELAALLPVLYPGVFPNLENLNKSKKARADLVAILLTGIPEGLIRGFTNTTGDTQADMLRLNTAIAPARRPNRLGVLGGDLAGYPNGRRVTDDVVTIALRAIAGLTVPLVDRKFTPDDAAAAVTPGLTEADVTAPFLRNFPFLGTPYDGFNNPSVQT